MIISVFSAFGQSDSINDTSMVKRIRNDTIIFIKYSFKEPSISIKTTSIQNSIIFLIETTDLRFQLLMNILSTTNEPN